MTGSTSTRTAEAREYSGGAVVASATAGILMIMVGVMHVLQGIAAIIHDTFFVVGAQYVYKFDVTTWGWIHLIAGIVVGLAGVAVFGGAVWARTIGVALACVSIIVNFLWIPYAPVWSITLIAFDVFVIWALTAHGRDITQS